MKHSFRFNGFPHHTVVLFGAFFFFGSIILSGCVDSALTEPDPAQDAVATRQTPMSSKFRHAHLLQRALRSAPGKSAAAGDLFLIVKLSDGVIDKQKVLERFQVLDRFQVLERYEYNNVFNGWAWQVQDSLGQNEFDQFMDQLAQDPDIMWFEPDFYFEPDFDTDPGSGPRKQRIPWSVAAIGGQTSWTVSGDHTGSVDVDLYILDTGATNSDLNVVEHLDFREGSSDAADYDGHGTHVAGIAAAMDDRDGVVGVAPGARVHNLKVLNDDGYTDVSVVIAAVEYVTVQKLADPTRPMVVNMSLGEDIGTPDYSALDEAVEASVAAGVVYVVAAGNHDTDASHVTPAKVHEAITVGSYDKAGRFSSFSNWGPTVDLLAPGEAIVSLEVSTSGVGRPVRMSGTSMAAAHVSGATALYLGQHPSATPQEVQDALVAAAQSFVWGVPASTTNRSVWVGEDSSSGDDDDDDENVAVAGDDDDDSSSGDDDDDD